MVLSKVSLSRVIGYLREKQLWEGGSFQIYLDNFVYWKSGTATNGYKPIQTIPPNCLGVLYVTEDGDIAICKPGEVIE